MAGVGLESEVEDWAEGDAEEGETLEEAERAGDFAH
ncbi:hypothetical protein KS4_32910 [Poriferisphaera corsica]|uniref:Uncharacterized protein n=1 Tax=Poriferisphaera corsica TaxID=2528020 RepID=A0A517YYA5_9BACT|nr:hypothetical protein KS4_32910 [Poriferisphaera corsica]